MGAGGRRARRRRRHRRAASFSSGSLCTGRVVAGSVRAVSALDVRPSHHADRGAGEGRCVKLLSQLLPVKLNLRFIFGILLETQTLETPLLYALTRLPVCQMLGSSLEKRGVGSGRMHAIFLLVKIMLVYLASNESTQRRQFISPTSHESYMYVESICSDSSHQRKQEARNRAMLVIKASKLLHKSHPTQGIPGNIAISSTSSPPGAASTALAATPSPVLHAAARGVQPQLDSASNDSTANELTGEELKAVANGSLAYLRLHESTYYMHHLVAATLALALAGAQAAAHRQLVREGGGRQVLGKNAGGPE